MTCTNKKLCVSTSHQPQLLTFVEQCTFQDTASPVTLPWPCLVCVSVSVCLCLCLVSVYIIKSAASGRFNGLPSKPSADSDGWVSRHHCHHSGPVSVTIVSVLSCLCLSPQLMISESYTLLTQLWLNSTHSTGSWMKLWHLEQIVISALHSCWADIKPFALQLSPRSPGVSLNWLWCSMITEQG